MLIIFLFKNLYTIFLTEIEIQLFQDEQLLQAGFDMKNIILMFSAFSILFISCGDSGPANAPIQTVSVVKTKADSVTIYDEFVGQVYGQKDIAIRARVEGFLDGIYFEEGSTVKKGQLLYKIESQPYEADVAAMMSRVVEAKTRLAKTESDLRRIRPLAENNAVSQSDLDEAVANYDASVASLEAAEANLDAARIYLSYTQIKSPLTGIIGKTKSKVGDFVGRSYDQVVLNEVSLIDTMLVEFFITENQYLQLMRNLIEKYPEIEKTGTIPQQRAENTLELILADGSIYELKGKVKFIDRNIDPTTGAILVQATFPNPTKLLRPGLFSKVKAKLFSSNDAILIPQRCIMELQGMYSVYVVDNDNKIESREITVGEKLGSDWMILDGLKSGENVVYEGIQKVRAGVTVKIEPAQINLENNENME